MMDKSNNILINVVAKPGAKQNNITGDYGLIVLIINCNCITFLHAYVITKLCCRYLE